MKDLDIRPVLRDLLTRKYAAGQTTLVLDEFSVCGGLFRADLTVVNGQLKGYEIKSDHDSLRRLRSQSAGYAKVFDTMTLVTGARHLRQARRIVPPWWGLVVAERDNSGRIVLRDVRRERVNREPLPSSLAQLIWRAEALTLLRRHNLHVGLCNKSRQILWQAMVSNFSLRELRAIVRDQLKEREFPRPVDLRMQCGAMSPLDATSSNYRNRHFVSRSQRYSYHPS
jgi:hypothetical protein